MVDVVCNMNFDLHFNNNNNKGVFLQDLTYIDVAFSEQHDLRQQKSDEVIATLCQWQHSTSPYRHIHALSEFVGNLKVICSECFYIYLCIYTLAITTCTSVSFIRLSCTSNCG